MSAANHSAPNHVPLFFGHLLLWSGFLAAAFLSVLRTEQADKWSTIPWIWYLLALAIGFVGVVLVRLVKSHDTLDEAKTEAEYSVVRNSLEDVLSSVARLNASADRTPNETLGSIDGECVESLSEFAEARQAIVKRFGLNTYADVMTEFASGERLINRAWSAAADGYVDEVSASLTRAEQHLRKAKELLDTAESDHA